MLLSGPKSYYDDYVRKKDTTRTLADPPSLLTDRGAYVNFLEVQLERVSAACLGVQSYDQRFNDMQGLIVSLEQRCASTTKLVGLAQQCTEELRNQTEERMEKISEHFKSEQWEIRNLVETMSMRIAAVEQTLSRLPAMERRQDDTDTWIRQCEEQQEAMRNQIDSNNKESMLRMDRLDADYSESSEAIESLRTATSKHQFDLQETASSLKNSISAAESRVMEAMEEKSEHHARQVHLASAKATEEAEKLQMDSVSREAGCLAAVRLLGESLREEAEKLQEKCEEDLEHMQERFTEELQGEMKAVHKRIEEHIAVINDDVETQKRLHSSFVESSKSQLKQLDRAIGSISQEQEEMYRSTCDLQLSVQQTQLQLQSSPMQTSALLVDASQSGAGDMGGSDRAAMGVSFSDSPPSMFLYPRDTSFSSNASSSSSTQHMSTRANDESKSRAGADSGKEQEGDVEGEAASRQLHVNSDNAINACRERAAMRQKQKEEAAREFQKQRQQQLYQQQHQQAQQQTMFPSPDQHALSHMHGYGPGMAASSGNRQEGSQLAYRGPTDTSFSQQTYGPTSSSSMPGEGFTSQTMPTMSTMMPPPGRFGETPSSASGLHGTPYSQQQSQHSASSQWGQSSGGHQQQADGNHYSGQRSPMHTQQHGSFSEDMNLSHANSASYQQQQPHHHQQHLSFAQTSRVHPSHQQHQSSGHGTGGGEQSDGQWQPQQQAVHPRKLAPAAQHTSSTTPNSQLRQTGTPNQQQQERSFVSDGGRSNTSFNTAMNASQGQGASVNSGIDVSGDVSVDRYEESFDASRLDRSSRSAELGASIDYESSQMRAEAVSTMENADDESVSSLGGNAKLRSTVTIHSPSKHDGDGSYHSGASSKEYIDYVGGGLYCNSKKHDDLGNRRASALGLSYIGTGLYVDPAEVKSGFAEAKRTSDERGRGGIAGGGDKKRKPTSEMPRHRPPTRSASPGRRPPPPPSGSSVSAARGSSVAESEHSSSSAGVRASTEAFERFLNKYRGGSAAGFDDDDEGSLSSRSMSWSDALLRQSPVGELVMSEYMEFKQQQQTVPWQPVSKLAKPLGSTGSPTRCTKVTATSSAKAVTPGSAADMSISFDDSTTIATSASRTGQSQRRTAPSTPVVTAPALDKIAPERRHYSVPRESFQGASAQLQTKF